MKVHPLLVEISVMEIALLSCRAMAAPMAAPAKVRPVKVQVAADAATHGPARSFATGLAAAELSKPVSALRQRLLAACERQCGAPVFAGGPTELCVLHGGEALALFLDDIVGDVVPEGWVRPDAAAARVLMRVRAAHA